MSGAETQREKKLAYNRKHYQEHRERYLDYRKKHYEENRDKILAYAREWRKKHPGRMSAHDRKRKYGVSKEQFEALILLQKNSCAVCHTKFNGRRIHIDHCHSTKVIRGLLCHKCNTSEGMLGSVENARKLYEYMLKNELFYQGKN